MLTQKYSIILASGSPRRQELLKNLGISFDVEVSDIDESFSPQFDIDYNLKQIALRKAEAISKQHDSENLMVISGDTVVELEGQIFGKPSNNEEAVSMLQKLSGKMHVVKTAYCIWTEAHTVLGIEQTKVYFSELSDNEIQTYVNAYHPLDKAGAYGIQEWIGTIGIEKIEGDFYNVMGLPLHRIYQILKSDFEF